MRMTDMQKADYKLYRRECRMSGVEPTLKDFLAFDIPECVIAQLGWFMMEIVEAPSGYFEENDRCRPKEEYLKLELARDKCLFIEVERAIDPAAYVKHLETCQFDQCH